MEACKHLVQYYETDKMSITHHSNYVRWMEEARVSFLEQINWNYDRLETYGVVSPVVSLDCKYLKTTTFPDLITINVSIGEYNGIKLGFHYEMFNKNGEMVFKGNSVHCFLNEKGRPVRIPKEFPEFDKAIKNMIADQVK